MQRSTCLLNTKENDSDTVLTVAAAQCVATRGSLEENVSEHLAFIETAAEHAVDLIVFPELSLTGYELDVAKSLQLGPDDAGLERLRNAAAENRMSAIVGAPCASDGAKPNLGAFLLAQSGTDCYAKIHVHETELPYFIAGRAHSTTLLHGVRIGLAICADASYSSHAAAAAESGVEVYVASVMKTDGGFADHARRMRHYASHFGMATLTANFAGSTGGQISAGRSAIWDEQGMLVAQAPGNDRVLVIGRREGMIWHGQVIQGQRHTRFADAAWRNK